MVREFLILAASHRQKSSSSVAGRAKAMPTASRTPVLIFLLETPKSGGNDGRQATGEIVALVQSALIQRRSMLQIA